MYNYVYKSKIGVWYKISANENAIIGFKKANEDECFENGDKTSVIEECVIQVEKYFSGNLKNFTVPIEMIGTEFQKKVWNALCNIPYGETHSYKEVAQAVGNEKASRAVGMANNRNTIGIIVPCHRVIGSSGKMVGYAGGIDIKEKLLEIEKNNK